MVQMGMGQHYGRNGLRVDRQRCAIAQAKLLETLKEAAVDKNPDAAGFQQILGPRHGSDGTKKCQFYTQDWSACILWPLQRHTSMAASKSAPGSITAFSTPQSFALLNPSYIVRNENQL